MRSKVVRSQLPGALCVKQFVALDFPPECVSRAWPWPSPHSNVARSKLGAKYKSLLLTGVNQLPSGPSVCFPGWRSASRLDRKRRNRRLAPHAPRPLRATVPAPHPGPAAGCAAAPRVGSGSIAVWRSASVVSQGSRPSLALAIGWCIHFWLRFVTIRREVFIVRTWFFLNSDIL